MLLRLTKTYLRPYAAWLAALLALQLLGTLASLYLPSLNGQIIDKGVVPGDTGFVIRTGAVMLAVSLIQIAATIAATYIAARSAGLLGRDLRADLFRRVGSFSARELTSFGAPTLISRNTNDVTQVQTVVYMSLVMMLSARSSSACCRGSARCRIPSTRSTGSCASKLPAFGWSGPSCARISSGRGSPPPTAPTPTLPWPWAASWRSPSRW